MNSLVSYPNRGSGGDAKWRGNCSPRLVADLCEQFRPKLLIDPMMGSGTTRDVASQMGIGYWGSDLHEGFDARTDEIPAVGDMGFLHPPYWLIIPYSGAQWGNSPDPRDLSRITDYGEFIAAHNEVQYRLYEQLQPGGHMAVLVGDIRRQGRFYSMSYDMRHYGDLVAVVIKAQHNMTSNSRAYSGNFVPIVHETMVVTRKPGAFWVLPVRKSVQGEIDLRTFKGQTWGAMVREGLRQAGGHAALETLYTVLQGHARVKEAEANNIDWRAIVRRELQERDWFANVARGEWRLAA